ncbi:ParB/RepB/Spo0J family partition protein [Maritimibacter sp. DP1N21-5]|uniref:ParB/RepB/Spo0J family partition protein n=1 Tax=Maritimibacter sp. DP1N21-5 TaxID=2836867 RepID=UPI001C497992|nr:ParB/RepB/Spo0J family partition protein [Maritimibacter sp. DP1N21-5]MBV7408178.1 ParB/RepB/Spo0J family partition protein [Maritimibacter sp. DP1N21-5]
MTNLHNAPLSHLFVHTLNPRQSHDPAEVEAKMRSILSVGLINPLAGHIDTETGEIGIVAGGYRLLALQRIAKDFPERTDLIDAIPVNVTEDWATARAWGIAAQTQTDLTPAEEIRAYGTMARDGYADPATIARAFGVTEKRVRQRLKLADLPDPVIDALAARDITLDVAAALTTAPTPDRAVEVMEAARRNDWPAHRVKHELHGGEIRGTDRRAVFVGADRYEAEGGHIERDLFSEDTWFPDETLLNSLFDRCLKEAKRDAEAEGWSFVWTNPEHYPFNDPRLKGLEEVEPEPVDLPEADEAEFERLLETPLYQRSMEDRARLDELETRARGTYTNEQVTACGILLWVDHEGTLRRSSALLPPGATAQDDDQDSDDAAEAPAPKPESPEPSQAVRSDMHAIATRARQMALLSKPELARQMLAYQLSIATGWERIFSLTPSHVRNLPDMTDGMEPGHRLDAPNDHNAKITAEGFAAFRAKGMKHTNEVLTQALARLLDGSTSELAKVINAETGVDVRAIWHPTEAFFKRLPTAALDAIMQDLLHDADEEMLAKFAVMKKSVKANELGRLFTNLDLREAWGISREQGARLDRWIPAEMRDELGIVETRVAEAAE